MSHFYTDEGFLLSQVENKSKPGSYRDFNLGDARKIKALPSVTTILSLLAKPGLVRWQVEQGIKAALTPSDEWSTLTEPELIRALAYKSEEWVRWTADFGTSVHWFINQKLKAIPSLEIPPMVPFAEELANDFIDWTAANGFIWEKTEHRFARRDLGYGGSVDLIGTYFGEPCVVDIKTQSQPLVFHSPEWPLQLAGYDYALPKTEWCICGHESLDHGFGTATKDTICVLGCECIDYKVKPRMRISIIIDRDNPGQPDNIKHKLWIDDNSTIAETNQRWDKTWSQLLELWFSLNRYDPRC